MKRRFDLYIECDNDAFGNPNPSPEIRRILKMVRWMLGQVFWGQTAGLSIMDTNGNKVGRWQFNVLPEGTVDPIDAIRIYCEGVKADFPETATWMDNILILTEGRK